MALQLIDLLTAMNRSGVTFGNVPETTDPAIRGVIKIGVCPLFSLICPLSSLILCPLFSLIFKPFYLTLLNSCVSLNGTSPISDSR